MKIAFSSEITHDIYNEIWVKWLALDLCLLLIWVNFFLFKLHITKGKRQVVVF